MENFCLSHFKSIGNCFFLCSFSIQFTPCLILQKAPKILLFTLAVTLLLKDHLGDILAKLCSVSQLNFTLLSSQRYTDNVFCIYQQISSFLLSRFLAQTQWQTRRKDFLGNGDCSHRLMRTRIREDKHENLATLGKGVLREYSRRNWKIWVWQGQEEK